MAPIIKGPLGMLPLLLPALPPPPLLSHPTTRFGDLLGCCSLAEAVDLLGEAILVAVAVAVAVAATGATLF